MAAMPSRLSVVTIGARDLPTLRSFYRALGWSELSVSDETWSAFLLGGALLALYPLPALAAEAASGVSEPAGGWSGVTLACNVDNREQVDTAFATAVQAGATVVTEPTDRSWGGRSAYIADPEGNRWEIAWARTALFDERGALVSFG
ncbi:VOC family protein [Micromonospora sp. KC213]|uniref:VOC family protein n=1 Tax=Micromonospora sp. KC213 TaxID=2530378 RepID=UPI001044B8CF|nr:VOC family protein [Micromonospora sp. KC213]TDC43670.1 glyoxalase [Micromonospora sp. KC213]